LLFASSHPEAKSETHSSGIPSLRTDAELVVLNTADFTSTLPRDAVTSLLK